VIFTVAPLKQRPPGWDRWPNQYSPFRSTYSQTLDLLDRELGHLRASNPMVQVDASPGHIRMDGQLRADAKVNYPGVILSFETKKFGTLSYPCNKFDGGYKSPGWQANLRAIALGLEALRKVERYGIAERRQQYAGYAELGTGIALGAGMTVEQAAEFISEHSIESPLSGRPVFTADEVLHDADTRVAAFRIASRLLHPDTGGDDGALFHKLVQARELLDGHS
jgi:hypothetical protein